MRTKIVLATVSAVTLAGALGACGTTNSTTSNQPKQATPVVEQPTPAVHQTNQGIREPASRGTGQFNVPLDIGGAVYTVSPPSFYTFDASTQSAPKYRFWAVFDVQVKASVQHEPNEFDFSIITEDGTRYSPWSSENWGPSLAGPWVYPGGKARGKLVIDTPIRHGTLVYEPSWGLSTVRYEWNF